MTHSPQPAWAEILAMKHEMEVVGPASHTGNGGPLSHLRLGAPSGTAQRKWAPAVSSYGLPWLALAPLLIPLSLAYTPAKLFFPGFAKIGSAPQDFAVSLQTFEVSPKCV